MQSFFTVTGCPEAGSDARMLGLDTPEGGEKMIGVANTTQRRTHQLRLVFYCRHRFPCHNRWFKRYPQSNLSSPFRGNITSRGISWLVITIPGCGFAAY